VVQQFRRQRRILRRQRQGSVKVCIRLMMNRQETKFYPLGPLHPVRHDRMTRTVAKKEPKTKRDDESNGDGDADNLAPCGRLVINERTD